MPSAARARPPASRLLAGLKADERTAIVLQAGGFSYAEIGAMRGWTYTKVNRCLAEGRAALRGRAAPGSARRAGKSNTGKILTMRVTSKGQVTIPKEIRDEAGLLPGTDVEFTLERGVVRVRRAKGSPSRGDRLVERLRSGRPHFTMTTDEIMALTRGED